MALTVWDLGRILLWNYENLAAQLSKQGATVIFHRMERGICGKLYVDGVRR
jgi:hypothetical protein